MITLNALRPSRVTVITFDCYGTLVDWNAGIGGAFEAAAREDGVELDRERALRVYHEIEPELERDEFLRYRDVLTEAARYVAARCDWQISIERAAFLADSLPDWPLFHDTNAALTRLAQQFRLGVLSNVDESLFLGTLEHFDVDFDFWVTADRVESYKPDLAHWEAARPFVGDPSGWLHVAQSLYHDVTPANTLGIPVIWVNRLQEELPPDGPLPDHEVPSMAALADWLLQ